ncbi:alkaline phosphatase family protein [Fulvivirgaceae bacterium BMA12]|uniref:Alkaline phosphatase family protein n=1 Tax=Agaribacillus aureus TaxID=3051825 RepID=A0ABT8L0T4_9BACT|nr:alkaline phosphatase family protein [Fulvivirgaceae bacterium BMA12]
MKLNVYNPAPLLFSLTSAIFLYACTNGSNQTTLKQRTSHLIVIGVDGMSPDGIINAETPVMDQLIKEGSHTLNARGVLPTSSSTNWASMVSGAGPEQHGITSNGWERDDHTLPAVTTGREKIFPTIFSVIKNQKPDLKMAAIYDWGGFGRLIERSILDYDRNGEDEDITAKLAIDYIKSEQPHFLFVHLDHVDHAGHHYGHKTSDYYKSVTKADKLIGEIIQASKDAGLFEETIFIVSADHGGIGYGHGGETLDEIEIPFIIYGKGIKKNKRISQEVYQYDNAATVAYAFGLKQPYAWIGKPVKSVFEGNPDPVLDKNTVVRVPAPVIIPKPNLYEPAGGLFIDENAVLKIESSDEVKVRYTLDGQEPTENSPVYSDPITLDKTTVVMARAFGAGQETSRTAKAYFRVVHSDNGNGVRYDYFEGTGWHSLPLFEKLKPLKSGSSFQIRIDSINDRKDQFAIRYSTYLKIEQAGSYKFYLVSDDGSKLFINNQLIVDNDGGHGAIERSGTAELEAGMALLEVTYFNEGGGYWLDTYYKGPGIPKQIIPADKLFLNRE